MSAIPQEWTEARKIIGAYTVERKNFHASLDRIVEVFDAAEEAFGVIESLGAKEAELRLSIEGLEQEFRNQTTSAVKQMNKTLEETVEKHTAEVTRKEDARKIAEKRANDAERDAKAAETKLTGVQNRLAKATEEVSKLEEDKAKIETEIAGLKARLG